MTNRDVEIAAAAYLYAGERTQEQVAGILGVNQSVVSRRLEEARKNGWLTDKPQFHEAGFDAQDLQRIRNVADRQTAQLRDLLVRFGSLPAKFRFNLHVFAAGKSEGNRYVEFGRNAARLVADLIPDQGDVGVSWGRTIAGIVEALDAASLPKRRTDTLRFFPTCGEPLTARGEGASATQLAERLQRLLVLEGPASPRLSAVGACIHRKLNRKAILDYFRLLPDYRTVVSSNDSLLSRMTTVITGVGTATTSDDLWLRDRLEATGMADAVLARATYGDIGGVYIKRPGVNQRRLALINGVWTGIRRDHLETCARKAANAAGPGVVVVAIGSEKAEIVQELVRENLINELVVDYGLAQTLEASLGASR